MLIPRQTHKVLAPPIPTFPLKQKMMKMRKFSIPSTFASVCWFSSLFALCFFSFLYLHPRDTTTNCVDVLKVNDSKPTTLTTSSKFVSNETNPIDNHLDLTEKEKAEVVINSTSSSSSGTKSGSPNVVPNDDGLGSNSTSSEVIELPSINKVEVPPPQSEEQATSNSTSNEVISPPNDEQASNTTPSEGIELPSTNTEEPPPPNDEQASNSTTIVEVVDQTPAPTIEEENDEVYDAIPQSDVFAFPPWNCTKEERIDWLRRNLDETKIIKSTSRTQNFDEKIQAFLNNNNCKERIFLTWISPASLFGTRELLALESMIKAHPEGCVIIISRRMDSNPGRAILRPLLDRGHRILTLAPDFRFLFSNTPAQGWLDRLEAGDVDPGTVPITQNLSNLLRMAVLYKYGGIYLDTDMIILKSVSDLSNAIGIQSVDDETRIWRTLNNAVLIFDKEHPLLWKFMEEFATTFDGFTWGFNGPYLATRVVTKTFNDTMYQFNLLSPMVFYPVDWIRIHRLFEKPYKKGVTWAENKFLGIKSQSYGVHLWNKQTRGIKIEPKSPMGKLISKHCIICQNIYDS